MLQSPDLGPCVLHWPMLIRTVHAICRRLQIPSLSGRIFGRFTAGDLPCCAWHGRWFHPSLLHAPIFSMYRSKHSYLPAEADGCFQNAGSRLLHLVSRQWSVCSADATSRSAPLHGESRHERRTDLRHPRGHNNIESLARRSPSNLAETARRDESLGHRAGNVCRQTAKTRARRGRNRDHRRVSGSNSVGGGPGRAERTMVLDSVDEDTLQQHVPSVAEEDEDTPHGHMVPQLTHILHAVAAISVSSVVVLRS